MIFFKKPMFWTKDGPVRVLNPLLIILERLGLVLPRLVAVLDVGVEWPLDPDDESDESYEEEVTYYLLEFPSGRREYDWHAYGKAEEVDYYEVNLRDVILWVHGGPLPPGTRAPQRDAAEVVPLKVIRDNTQTPPRAE